MKVSEKEKNHAKKENTKKTENKHATKKVKAKKAPTKVTKGPFAQKTKNKFYFGVERAMTKEEIKNFLTGLAVGTVKDAFDLDVPADVKLKAVNSLTNMLNDEEDKQESDVDIQAMTNDAIIAEGLANRHVEGFDEDEESAQEVEERESTQQEENDEDVSVDACISSSDSEIE